jgi:hypothetical protein
VIESPDAAVQEKVVMIAANDATLAHCTVEGSSRDVLATAGATVSIASLRLVIAFKRLFLGDEQVHLIILLDVFCVAKSI